MPERLVNRRTGAAYRAVTVVLSLLGLCVLVAWLMAQQVDWSPGETGPLMHVVQRGEFLHEIVEDGEVESASNIEIRCEVQARGAGGVTILKLIPEGTYVQPGDELVVLDASALKNERNQQLITCSNSEAAVATAINDLAAAEIARDEYLKGTYVLNQNLIQNKMFVAREAQRQAEQTLAYSQGLARKGYVTDLRVETDRIAVEKAKNDYESAVLELKTLDDYTKAKMLKQLESAIGIAKAKLASAQATNKIDQEQLALIESQIAKCTILAPEAGQVVYANEFRRHGGQDIVIEEGTMIRERQTIIRLPDPRRMQVAAKINEAKIALVREGMPARIELDAFADREFDGVVERVNEYPAPSSFWAANVKEYEAYVTILGSPANLKPGLNAEVRIQVELLHGVLQVPVQAVLEHGGKYYCILPEREGWRAQAVAIGSTNEKTIVIREGLKEGDRVVLGAFDYREKVKLPKIADKPRRNGPVALPEKTSAASGDRPAAADDKKPAQAPGGQDPFARLDADGNGKIEKGEVPERLQQFFPSLDKNSDGALGRDEWAAAAQMMRQRPGGPGAAPGGPRP